MRLPTRPAPFPAQYNDFILLKSCRQVILQTQHALTLLHEILLNLQFLLKTTGKLSAPRLLRSSPACLHPDTIAPSERL